MARALTVQNAEINTASITIRTLQVEGRQVTMGVFRQLPEHDIIDPQGPSLRGVGWGHVNYQVSGHYRYTGRDIHLVWQKGSELRRCLVHETRVKPEFAFRELTSDISVQRIETYRKYAEEKPGREHYLTQANEIQATLDHWRAERIVALNRHQNELRWIDARNALVAPLFDLPQLFIAV